jgi:L-aspartate oxidase
MKTDVLIIGSGIAGLTFAIKFASVFPGKSVTLVTKQGVLESSTNLAQGGIAVALDKVQDSFEKHIEDTLKAGDDLCSPEVVDMAIREAPGRLRDLQQWGINFDCDDAGDIQLAMEGGHSVNRVVHRKDATGNYVAERLSDYLQKIANVKILPYYFAVDLVTERRRDNFDKTCIGSVVLDVKAGRLRTISASVTVIATGGAGQVYQTTTNPIIATGDGIAMAHRAGASIANMEFVQFHPTAFYSKDGNPSFLISEAVRGFGGFLRSKSGARFVFEYDQRGELASRDIVSKAIHQEMLKSGESSVFLDCTHFSAEELTDHFPNIFDHCLKRGFDISKTLLPVAPAAHYLCGGIVTDGHGRTTIDRLYACGECACTGMHGANRLASNSLLESLVFAHRIFLDVGKRIGEIKPPGKITHRSPHVLIGQRDEWITEKRKEIRCMMSACAGIIRTTALLDKAQRELHLLANQLEEMYSLSFPAVNICELRNLVATARLIISQALHRRENKGTHYNRDLA